MKLRNVALAAALVLAFVMARPTGSQAGVHISIGPYGVHAGYGGYRYYGYRHYYRRPYYPNYRKRYYGHRYYQRKRYYRPRYYGHRRYRHYPRHW